MLIISIGAIVKRCQRKEWANKLKLGKIPMPGHWPAVPWQPIRTWLAGRDSDSWPGLKVEAY